MENIENKEEKEITKAEPIRITDSRNHREYILDFTRETVVFAEDRDFDWDLVVTKPATMIPLIWWVAFRRYQPKVSKTEAEELLNAIGGVTPAILARLHELYDQSITSLINLDEEESAEESAKNVMVSVKM